MTNEAQSPAHAATNRDRVFWVVGIAASALLLYVAVGRDGGPEKATGAEPEATIAPERQPVAREESKPVPDDKPREPAACSFMGSEFKMRSWKTFGTPFDAAGNDWQCTSDYLDIVELQSTSTSNLSNVAYYVVGRADGPRQLRLVLNVNDPRHKTDALKDFARYAARLHVKALGMELPGEIGVAIAKTKPSPTLSVGSAHVSLTRENYGQGGIRGGFTLRYIVDM